MTAFSEEVTDLSGIGPFQEVIENQKAGQASCVAKIWDNPSWQNVLFFIPQ
jgi:hypothetical protein